MPLEEHPDIYISPEDPHYLRQILGDSRLAEDHVRTPPDVIFMTSYGIREDQDGIPSSSILQTISVLSLLELVREVRRNQRQGEAPYKPIVFLSSGHPVSETDTTKEEQILQALLNSWGICECITPSSIGAHSAWDTRSEIICFKNFFRRITSANRTLTITSAPHLDSVIRMMTRVGITNYKPEIDMQIISSEGLLNYLCDYRLIGLLLNDSESKDLASTLNGLVKSEAMKMKFLDFTSRFNDRSGFTLSAIAFALQLFNAKELALRATRRTRR
ncbi:MAG: hypothetical protein QXL34_07335 [Thermosphaera sp.]